MIKWYKKVVFENFANFDGRARRSEFWYFILAFYIFVALLILVGVALTAATQSAGVGMVFFILYILYALLNVIPNIAVIVRRLHDVGKSGWYYFIILIPIIGSIWMLILLCTEGDSGQNEYGPDPKGDYQEVEEIGTPEA
ncbi:MAG: DUF805 domain-containing protein [Flavobacterium sp.]|nr:DUF805 domain-containing protein [Flavobacterium sp.]